MRPSAPAALLRELGRAVAWHRGLLAAGLTAAAVALGLSALAPAPAATVRVIGAARDLAAGQVLTVSDLRALDLPPDLVPGGAQRPGAAVLGRLLAGPVRRGEPLTDVRLVGPTLLAALGTVATGGPALVAVPVRIADAASTSLLRSGDHVDVLAASAPAEPAGSAPVSTGAAGSPGARAGSPATVEVAAADVVVLAVPPAGEAAPADGALVVLATTSTVAARLAGAAVAARLSLTLRAG